MEDVCAPLTVYYRGFAPEPAPSSAVRGSLSPPPLLLLPYPSVAIGRVSPELIAPAAINLIKSENVPHPDEIKWTKEAYRFRTPVVLLFEIFLSFLSFFSI